MPIRFYIIRDRKTMKVEVLKVEGNGPNMPAYISPPDPGSPKDEAPPWVKEKKKRIN